MFDIITEILWLGHAGVNVRQRHRDGQVELIFDIMLKWAQAGEHATVHIQAPGNPRWGAQQAVTAPAELHHVHVSQVEHSSCPALPLFALFYAMIAWFLVCCSAVSVELPLILLHTSWGKLKLLPICVCH